MVRRECAPCLLFRLSDRKAPSFLAVPSCLAVRYFFSHKGQE
jgi:hypothetical protein